MPPLSSRQEKFCLEYTGGKSGQKAATDAGYSSHSARVTASRLLIKANIISRIAELQSEASSDKVMTVRQRKERLSEIAEKNKDLPVNPVQAIAELNKMDKVYTEGIIDNRKTINIIVSPETRELIGKVKERTIVQVQRETEGIQEK